MGKEFLTFGDIQIEKNKLYLHKTPILLRDVYIEKVLVSNKVSFGEKSRNTLLVKPLHFITDKVSADMKN